MTSANLGYRAIVAGAASVPALAVPALASASIDPFVAAAAAVAGDSVCTSEQIAAVEFEAVRECMVGPDGFGPGTPEFRKAIDHNLQYLAVGGRLAFATVGRSKSELIGGFRELCDNDKEEAAISAAETLAKAGELAKDLASIILAAELRTLSALANCCAKVES